MDIKLDKATKDYLLNPENDLITEFKTKAPGTFKHCEDVANMCEKIGRELKLDTDVLKILGLYHDIGKMWNPYYYSENQPKDYNIHDNLPPEISAYYIMSHVANSIAILVTKVPNISLDLLNCISQHHGDSVLKVFLNKIDDEAEKLETIQDMKKGRQL